MTTRLVGQPDWRMTRDDEGHRTYTLTSLVEADTSDGPANVLETPGLPFPGASWQIASDLDIWAWCLPGAEVDKHQAPQGDPHKWWTVKQKFTTKPPPLNQQRCGDQEIKDPLLEPPKISGSFKAEHEEATYDRFGLPILNSAHEVIRGPTVTFDKSRLQLKIQQNVSSPYLGYVLPALMIDCVNAFPLWGMPPRTIKLSQAPWERKFYGFCSVYYQRTLEFDINGNTFDRNILDEGTKVLLGDWQQTASGPKYVLRRFADGSLPQYYNPQHFKRYLDPDGNANRVILNGHGLPANTKVVSTRTVVVANNEYVPIGGLGQVGFWYTLGGRIGTWFRIGAVGNVIGFNTTSPHNLTTGQLITVSDVNAANAPAFDGVWKVTVLGPTSVTLIGSQGIDQSIPYPGGTWYLSGSITGINDGVTPCIVISPNHGLTTGQGVIVEGLQEGTGMNGTWAVTVVGGDTFSLQGSVASASPIPGTGTVTEEEITPPALIFVQKYNEADFIQLGIPLIF